MQIEVPASEVVDRITILELKSVRLDAGARASAIERLAYLTSAWQLERGPLAEVAELDELRQVNAQLWEIEDRLRHLEHLQDFGEDFVASARRVYLLNDRRAALKRAIDEACGSRWREHKGFS